MRQLFITGFAAIGLTIAAASQAHADRDAVIQKFVDGANACLKEHGVFAKTESDRGCYVVDGPRIYCDPGLPGGKSSKEVADECFVEASAAARPKRIGK